MVSTTTVNNNESGEKRPTGLPPGKYRLVGWDIDTTGRRLIDEICQIAAYTADERFSQYVMPYATLNPFAQRRHSVRVVTVSRYRMLKDLKTNKFLKTKSEVSALVDFLGWLEAVRGDDAADGVLLLCHEARKLAPAMLLVALRRYGLLERFRAVVAGFASGFRLAEVQCAATMKAFSLKVLARVLLDRDEPLSSAAVRARLCYLIAQHLGQSERQDLEAEGGGDAGASERHATALVLQYGQSVATEEQELDELKALLARQNTFRPVFKAMMYSSPVSRQHASWLRHLLVHHDLEYGQLRGGWEAGGRPALERQLQAIAAAHEPEYAELLDLLDGHFDPEKKPAPPARRPQRPTRPPRDGQPEEADKPSPAKSDSSPTKSDSSPDTSATTVLSEPGQDTPRSSSAEDLPAPVAAAAAN